MPTFKYALRESENHKWSTATVTDPVEWATEDQAKAGLEKQFPGMEVHVKMISDRPYIETRAQTQKSSKEIGNAGLAAMRSKLK